jgi:hypothetical protein
MTASRRVPPLVDLERNALSVGRNRRIIDPQPRAKRQQLAPVPTIQKQILIRKNRAEVR